MAKRRVQFRIGVCLLGLMLAGCAINSLRELTTSDALEINRSSSASNIQLIANVYTQHEKVLWVSGSVQNIYGNSVNAGHVHVRLWSPEHQPLADRKLALSGTAGTSRLQRGSRKLFEGTIAALPPAHSRLDIQYHTASD